MSMDKSWMQKPRLSAEYGNGVKEFLDYAFAHVARNDKIPCPCVKCNNFRNKTRKEVETDLICFGIVKNYIRWIMHGEGTGTSAHSSDCDGDNDGHNVMQTMVQDAFGVYDMNEQEGDEYMNIGREEPKGDEKKFYQLLEDAEKELYPGCKVSKLQFLVNLLQIKCLNGWTNTSLDMLLELLKKTFRGIETFPVSYYEARKTVKDLGLDYQKIDACPEDCMLFWKENAHLNECSICGTSRWKSVKGHSIDEMCSQSIQAKKVAAKMLWHFPLKPRLQRFFMSTKTAEHMRWHDEGRVKDGLLRHPADTKPWKKLDEQYPLFASEPRNVRLGLASDGFNPFSAMNINHSTWPVVLIPYNLPPWMCMKQPFFMLSLLIPGPRAPGNDIDVYLQPLIEELKVLWEDGVKTYDASREQYFQMRAAVLWTINDFPAYANLSGWSTKGEKACPNCNKDTGSYYLTAGHKWCYLDHRRYLPHDHRFRRDKKSFDGKTEFREAPKQLSGFDVLDHLCGYEQITFGKLIKSDGRKKRKRKATNLVDNWKKRSIFFELPYWKSLLLRHNLDVMHIEKNICDSIVGTLLDIEKKTKDNVKSRLDLQRMGIRKELQPKPNGNKYILPPACYNMSIEEKTKFCKFLKEVEVPDSYSSNFSRCVDIDQRKISGLKSHDCHVLLQQFLPLAMRGVLSKPVQRAIIELSIFFKQLCSKVLKEQELEHLESQIALTLCRLEMIFPPSFFDVMMHLPIHLAGEARIGGPVQYRWMYPIERYLRTLKRYVRNKNFPEGSIAEGYIAEECLIFCSRYLEGVETKLNRAPRNYDGIEDEWKCLSIFAPSGRPSGAISSRVLDQDEWLQVHRYVLQNCDEVIPFIEEHKQLIRNRNSGRVSAWDVDRIHKKEFIGWFRRHVREQDREQFGHLVPLGDGPSYAVTYFKTFFVNGYKFHTIDRDVMRKNQNSGVRVIAETVSFASSKDRRPITSEVCYYGVLKDIIELQYTGGNRVVLFKCDWFDVNITGRGGLKIDEYHFASLDFRRIVSKDDQFVLASQCKQAFYVQDVCDKERRIVINTEPRDFYDMEDVVDAYQQNECSSHDVNAHLDDDYVTWQRIDIPGTTVDKSIVLQLDGGSGGVGDETFIDDGDGDN